MKGRGDATTAVVERFVLEQLGKAIKARDAALKMDRRLSQMYAWFASADAMPLAYADKLDAMRPSPDKVLREVMRGGKAVLVPFTQAIAVVLRHGQSEAPSMDALKAMLCDDPRYCDGVCCRKRVLTIVYASDPNESWHDGCAAGRQMVIQNMMHITAGAAVRAVDEQVGVIVVFWRFFFLS